MGCPGWNVRTSLSAKRDEGGEKRRFWLIIPLCLMWLIWLERNESFI